MNREKIIHDLYGDMRSSTNEERELYRKMLEEMSVEIKSIDISNDYESGALQSSDLSFNITLDI